LPPRWPRDSARGWRSARLKLEREAAPTAYAGRKHIEEMHRRLSVAASHRSARPRSSGARLGRGGLCPIAKRLAVHLTAEVFPLLADGALAELAADIKANGLQVPIVIDDEAG